VFETEFLTYIYERKCKMCIISLKLATILKK